MSSDKDLKIQEMFKKNTILINQIDTLNAGIETLKIQLNMGADRINQLEDENAELKEKIKGFESGNVAWQGDMDATIRQNLELKQVLEHREKCIDWIQDHHPEIISEYLTREGK